MAKMIDKGVNLHKRLACGDTVQGYAKGGRVAVGVPMNPLTKARHQNGVRGMNTGGVVKKSCK